ncbi:hypothetical protein PIB30_014713, partial [Stylosanthes scabra]|nr:hypothetical protein [Stylosanthes scabra]
IPSGLSRMTKAPLDFWVDDPSTWSFQFRHPSFGISTAAISARKSDIACALIVVLGRNWMSNWDNSTAQLSIRPARRLAVRRRAKASFSILVYLNSASCKTRLMKYTGNYPPDSSSRTNAAAMDSSVIER